YLMSYGTVSGSGQIVANGQNGFNSHGLAAIGHAAGIDAGGGAGAGGTIIVNSVGHISGISLVSNGGTGGSQALTWNFSTDAEAEGPGGGGSGGYIGSSNFAGFESVIGGPNGTTNAIPMTSFLPNGATIGSGGSTIANLTNYYLSAKNDTICSGNSVILSASALGNPPPGTTLEWYTVDSGGTAIATGPTFTTPILIKTTTYYVGSCPGTYRVAVTVVVGGVGSVKTSRDTGICRGSSDTLNAFAVGAISYSWQPVAGLNNPNIANPIATPTVTTTYTVSVSTSCGTASASVIITVGTPPNITLNTSNNPICAGQPVTIIAGGGTAYSWSNNATTSSITITPAATTTYSVAVNNNGCTKDTSVKITVDPLPKVTITGNNTICAGTSTTITASGGTSYAWSNAATTSSITISPVSTTTYSVAVSNGNCIKDTTYTITVNAYPAIKITPDTSICSGSTITLNASGGGTYLWSNSATTSSIVVSPSSKITYSLVVSNNGCSKDSTVTVSINPSPTASITGAKAVCTGETTVLRASGGGAYRWSTGATTDTIAVNPAKATNYSVVVTDSDGCSNSASAVISIYNPTLFACCDTVIQPGHSTKLSAYTAGITHYKWLPDSGINCDTCPNITASPLTTTIYTVTGTDSLGCSVERIIIVEVAGPCTDLIIPNVFTPNFAGPNGVNNVFYINTYNFSAWSISIYDRWGKEIYTSANPAKYWNGITEGGGEAPDGVYYYIIDASCNGSSFKREGLVQLIR